MVSCLSSVRSLDRLQGELLDVARCRVSGVIIDLQLFEGNLSVFLSSKQSPTGCESSDESFRIQVLQKEKDEDLCLYLFLTGLLKEKYLSILWPIVKITGVMPDAKFHPFLTKLSIIVHCRCISHTALTLQSTAVGYLSQENCNSCLQYQEGRWHTGQSGEAAKFFLMCLCILLGWSVSTCLSAGMHVCKTTLFY